MLGVKVLTKKKGEKYFIKVEKQNEMKEERAKKKKTHTHKT